ncbi:MAG: aromatic ring-hydroxylating dioxygenase subunit alpha [Leptolyngbyaceae cyanobacterium RU_5_1]|nr:aromatic ring-hydroxylating dioxygenase subunit alpha [Leptolyngbyaceae cyanobacterium RU_5_1]
MELVTTLKSQTVRAGIREVGINPNHWYAVGWAKDLKLGQVMPVKIWEWAIAVYRDTDGQLHALEDICPHRGVALHKGKVKGANLACRYHGWEFDGGGQCVNVPYLPPAQKLPCAQTRSFPIQELHGLIWVFPGDPDLAETGQPPDIPELSQPGWLMVPITGHFQAHFSICNENTMDVFHGVLHEDLQGWFDPVLIHLKETETSVCAEYQISYKGQMAKFLGLSDRADQTTTLPITVEYHYPHYRSHLQGISSLYLMRLPVGPTESRSFAMFFFKVRLPRWLLKWLHSLLNIVLKRFFLLKFIVQDKEMMESEQQTYLTNPERRYVEINPAIIAVQRLTVRQYEHFVQRLSGELRANGHKDILGTVS